MQVSAGGQIDSVIINVMPIRPFVFEARTPGGRTHIGDGDTLALRGYHMNAITATNISTPGDGVTVSPVDSANARVAISTLAQPTCSGTAPSLVLSFTGIDGATVTGLTRKRAGELTLAPGEAKQLTDAEVTCLRFARDDNAQYLLA